MNGLQAISNALQRKLAAFQRNPLEEDEVLLQGAALLAIDAAIIMNSPALIAEAQEVIHYIEQWVDEQENGHQLEMQESHAAWLEQRKPLSEAHRLAKSIVGRTYNDVRWIKLVDAYREAFPTFIVRDFVYARLDPKQQAFRLRKFMSDVFEEKNLGRSPTESEMRDCLPEAKTRIQVQTLTYLERSLPGYAFQEHPILGCSDS